MEIKTNLESRWTKIIAENTKVTILSPYLTKLILGVIDTNKNNIDAIYTKFDIRDLCFCASDIMVLDKLLKMGINLYYNNKLHAKVVITKDIATIGSQNITSGSIKNFEISNTISSTLALKELEKHIETVRIEKEPITKQMIDEAKQIVLEFKDNKAELAVFFKEKQKSATKKRTNITTNLKKLIRSDEIHCIAGDSTAGYRDILKPKYNNSLCEWMISGEKFTTRRLHRHLIINTKDNAIGWARLGEKRINYVTNSFEYEEPNHKHTLGWKFSVEAITSKKLLNLNVNIALTCTKDKMKRPCNKICVTAYH
ncbi:MAG: hypothetical protein ACJAXS_002003 [Colwellia sp.]|jgi:hypothetical protein